jgi:hypothetical protein
MSKHRDRDLANLHELQLALVRPETPTPAPVPVLVEPVEPPSRSPRLKVQAKPTRTWRH